MEEAKRFTVCVECDHCVDTMPEDVKEKYSEPDSLWLQCTAKELPGWRCPLTGKAGYKDTLDDGTLFFTQTKHKDCDEINKDGNCKLFKPLEK